MTIVRTRFVGRMQSFSVINQVVERQRSLASACLVHALTFKTDTLLASETSVISIRLSGVTSLKIVPCCREAWQMDTNVNWRQNISPKCLQIVLDEAVFN
jgi:hypothetical protein